MIRTSTAAIAASIAMNACAAAHAYEWTGPDSGAYPETEVATNCTLHVNAERLESFSLTLESINITSKETVVAVGHDADEDGDLSFDEAAFLFGKIGSARYFIDLATGEREEVTGDTVTISKYRFDPTWNLGKIVERGTGESNATIIETVVNKVFVISIR